MEIDRSFRLGSGHDFLNVRALSLLDEEGDCMEWVPSEVEIVAGAFSGTFSATLTKEDFVSLRGALRSLYDFLSGEASFDTVEGQLAMEIHGDYKGHFDVKVTAMDTPRVGSKLSATIQCDQTELARTIHDLDAICDVLIRA